jgi:hypothetical protein
MPANMRALAVLLLTFAAAGCGDSDDGSDTAAKTTSTPSAAAVGGDQRQILETIDVLQQASREGNGARICQEVFTSRLARSVQRASKKSCASEVRSRLFKANVAISVARTIRVTGATATTVIRDQNGNASTLHLQKQNGRWRIARVTPQGAS